jgi:hypothetical protein
MEAAQQMNESVAHVLAVAVGRWVGGCFPPGAQSDVLLGMRQAIGHLRKLHCLSGCSPCTNDCS